MKQSIVVIFLLFTFSSIAQVGINTTDPRTTLDVNGAITNREVSFAVTSNAANIATQTSLANLTGTATATITVTSFTPTINGCRLIIANNTTGGFGATFAGSTIPNGQAIEFIYTNGGWQTTAGVSANIYNSNGTLTGNRTVTQGANSLTFTGTGNTIFNSGNVGIGTTPISKLQVNGGVLIGSGAHTGSPVNGTPMTFANPNNSAIWFRNFDNSTSNDFGVCYLEQTSPDVSILNILSGDNASGSGSDDSVFIGNLDVSGSKRGVTFRNGNLGIGITSPNAPLQFTTSTANRKIVLFESANNDNQFYGFGVNNGELRYQVSQIFANHIFYAGNSASTSTELMRIQGNGRVSIGNNNPLAQFDLRGIKLTGSGVGSGLDNDRPSQAIIPAGFDGNSRRNDWPAGWGGGLSTWDVTGEATFFRAYLTRSDYRLKNNIKTIDNSIFSNFMKIRPVTYFMKEQTKEMEGLQYGFIAQEIRDLFPSMVTKSDDSNGTIGMNYQALISPTIYVVQQQQAKIEELQKQIDSQNEKISNLIEELKKKIEILEAKINK